MNETTPPPFSPTASVPVEGVSRAGRMQEPQVRLSRLLFGLLLAVVTFDFCFWKVAGPGLSLSLFTLVLIGIVLKNRSGSDNKRTTGLLLALLAGAIIEAAVETGITNLLVLMILVVALAGHTFFSNAGSLWGAWISQVIAMLFAPGRIFWLIARLMEAGVSRGSGGIAGWVGSTLLIVPAVVLSLIFGSLLASGNAVFGSWTSSFFDWFWKELELYLDGWRFATWFLVAFIILPLLRPAMISEWWWKWTEKLPRLPGIIPAQRAILSSALILILLNLLFAIANIADALFLWSGQKLPAGVTYSEFVHHGVNTLTGTVLLSAFVLAAIFQQPLGVVQRRELKALAFLWIAQNLFMLLSVALRLKLYIEAYDMTVLRLSVMIFLVLVAAGFGLLTVKIIRDHSLSWLVGGCMLAVFATFYAAQFLNLSGWSANYNVEMWEKNRTRNLDLYYLYNLGPAAWPAVHHAVELGATWPYSTQRPDQPQNPLVSALHLESASPRALLNTQHWREFSLRAYWNRWALDDKK